MHRSHQFNDFSTYTIFNKVDITPFNDINLQKILALDGLMTKITKQFKLKDTFQQTIGGIILSGPFVVTEEVWRIAENLLLTQFFAIIILNMVLGYFALYEADKTRDVNIEQDIAGIPIRLISLISVGYLSVVFLIVLIAPQNTFNISNQDTIRAVVICSIFSIVGAATADSIF